MPGEETASILFPIKGKTYEHAVTTCGRLHPNRVWLPIVFVVNLLAPPCSHRGVKSRELGSIVTSQISPLLLHIEADVGAFLREYISLPAFRYDLH